jgi:hypothetical protein
VVESGESVLKVPLKKRNQNRIGVATLDSLIQLKRRKLSAGVDGVMLTRCLFMAGTKITNCQQCYMHLF